MLVKKKKKKKKLWLHFLVDLFTPILVCTSSW
jgi:hypothetical protein